jgi:hypothetical protein
MIVDWPVLSDDEIERLASDFRSQALGSLALNIGGAVPVEQIAEQHLGYDLELVDDDCALPGDFIVGICLSNQLCVTVGWCLIIKKRLGIKNEHYKCKCISK